MLEAIFRETLPIVQSAGIFADLIAVGEAVLLQAARVELLADLRWYLDLPARD